MQQARILSPIHEDVSTPAHGGSPSDSKNSLGGGSRGSWPVRLWRKVRPCADRDDHPVAPGGLPIAGHLPRLHLDAPGFLLRSQAELGPVFWVDLGFGRERLFCVGPDSLDLLRTPSVENDASDPEIKSMFGGSLVTADGASHRHMRSALGPSFSTHGLSVSGLMAPLVSLIEEHIERWLSRGSVDALPEMQDLTLEIVLRLAGVPVDRLHAWKQAYRDFILGLIPVPGHLPGLPRYRSARAQTWLNAELRQLVDNARLGHAQGGLLGTLTSARDENGEALSTDELVHNLRVILFAGHETSASVLAWVILLLARRPDLWRSLMDEHDAQAGGPLPSSPKDISKFPIAEAIFREALRLYPPVWFMLLRTGTDIVVSGRSIKAGTPMAISPAVLGLDKTNFPHPERFDAGRWTGRSRAPTPLELAPFGGGSHFCLGYGLALFEGVCLQIALARACKRRGLRPVHDGAEPRPGYLPLTQPRTTARVRFERA
ncbi:cytochrome P450 [Sorangium cellulosum]|uniref:Cytochrome P450 n=1 Tax=Sorangium cellulosum TaxID=56 RepID=A0A2L0EIL3_SORCE|nr:cytochrome P450 [Sorangium cellulosum]AUX39128.1 cytochrome P450 [Sorangium cellulosum]